MMTQTATANFNFDLTLSEAGGAPEGPQLVARDGRKWILRDADKQKVIAAFQNNRGDMALDYEHAQHHKALAGEKSPASGWLIAIEAREGDGLWGRVEWTAEAAEDIASRKYRFFSPEFSHDASGNIHSIIGGGLVNRPALVMNGIKPRANTPQGE